MTTDMRDPGELDAQPSAWIRTELESVSFGDERLTKRALKIVLWRGLQGLTWLSGAWLTFGPEAQLPAEAQSP
jgi:hypothetical protein